MRELILDIETCAVQNKIARCEIAATGIDAALKKAIGACKKEEAIQARKDEFYADPNNSVRAGQAAIYKTAVSPISGEVFSVGILDVTASDPVCVFYRTDMGDVVPADREFDLEPLADERALLVRALDYLTAPGSSSRIIGFNVQAFDLHFLWVRACVHRIEARKVLYHLVHTRNEGTVLDLQRAFYRSYKPQAGESLDRMCKCLGVDGKGDGVSGSDVPRLIEDGEIGAVLEYAAQDVEITRDAALAMGAI